MSETMALAKPSDLYALFESKRFHEKLTAAIPNALRAERMVQLALTMIKGSPALLKCRPISLMACVVECAQLGLELDKVLGHAYLVPFADECTLIVGYRGFMHLMYQSGSVTAVSAEVVRAKDKFRRTLGTDRKLFHDPAALPKVDNPETWQGAYAVAKFLNGEYEFEYMEAGAIEAARNRSASWHAWLKYKKSTPWQTDMEAMWKKTPIRRLAKRMPVSTTDQRAALLRAVMIDEYGERKGLLKPTEEGFVLAEDPEAEPIEASEDLTGKLQESIEIVNAGKKGGKPPREPKKPPKAPVEKQAESKNPSPVPKAKIPPAPKIDDPFLTTKQQTEIFNAAAQAGWKIPEELSAMIQKHYKVRRCAELRVSQLAEILGKISSGT